MDVIVLLPVAGLVGGRREIAGNGMRNTAALAAAGVLGIGIGSLFYVFAVQEAGAGRTAVLTSTQPLFALPLAVLFLREKITPKVVLGTAHAGVVVYDLPGTANARILWGTGRGNYQRSGSYLA